MDGQITLKENRQSESLWIRPLELQIIQSFAKGNTAKEIAVERGISYKTVESHRHNVLKRLKIRNMPQLINTLWEQKILF